jgi:hypothetical protein
MAEIPSKNFNEFLSLDRHGMKNFADRICTSMYKIDVQNCYIIIARDENKHFSKFVKIIIDMYSIDEIKYLGKKFIFF